MVGGGPTVCTPNTVELISTLGAIFPRGGPVQDPLLTNMPTQEAFAAVAAEGGAASAAFEAEAHDTQDSKVYLCLSRFGFTDLVRPGSFLISS